MPIVARRLVWWLVIGRGHQLKNCGSRYRQFIVNVLSVTPIFGTLTKKFYQVNLDCKAWFLTLDNTQSHYRLSPSHR